MGFPQTIPGGGGGLANAYANITDGTNTANAAGADTIDFVSPDGSILFTVVPGSPGIVQAQVARPKILLYSAGALANVNTFTGAKSLLGGAQTILPASTLKIGDLLHLHAIGTINNTSGVSSTVFVNLALLGVGDGTQTPGKTMVTGSSGNWLIDQWGVVTNATGVVLTISIVSSISWLSPATNNVILANSIINPVGVSGGMYNVILTYNVPLTFDVVGNSTAAASANLGFSVTGVAVERYAAGF